jgi:rhodanese-related sulfurtransferase
MLKLKQVIVFLGLLFLISARIFAQDFTACQNNEPDPTILPVAISWPDNHNKQSLDKKNWLTIQQLSQQQLQHAVWVDVRSGIKDKESGLDMLAIPLHQLSGAQFLFDKPVILVGSGFDQLPINQAIKHLRKKGFKHIFALSGGIYAWQKLHRPVHLHQQEISAEEFLSGGKTIRWQIIAIGLNAEQLATLPEQPIKQFALSQTTASVLKQFIHNNSKSSNDFIHYVLVSPDKQTVKRLQQQISFADSANIIWLRGGITAYQHYVQQQTKLIKHAGQSLSRPCRLTI